uniref:Uncharacterized protein n=1 Tax=Aegilops tauschii subsp. strangulata TaxID=200361 RepID=A0A453PR51_AEGTS
IVRQVDEVVDSYENSSGRHDGQVPTMKRPGRYTYTSRTLHVSSSTVEPKHLKNKFWMQPQSSKSWSWRSTPRKRRSRERNLVSLAYSFSRQSWKPGSRSSRLRFLLMGTISFMRGTFNLKGKALRHSTDRE